jgi:hypothetical protein
VPDETPSALARLEADGLIQRQADGYRTTRRWQGAMARAALRLLDEGDREGDVRLTIVHALVEIYGADFPDDELVRMVAAILPIEARELDPRASGQARNH